MDYVISDADMNNATDCESIAELLKEINHAWYYSNSDKIELAAKKGILEQRKADLGCS